MASPPGRGVSRAGRRLVAAVLSAVVAVACGGSGPATGADGEPTPAPRATSPSPSPTAAGAGETRPADGGALAFTAPALSGGTIRGADLAGQDVVLWMWAPW